MTDIDLELESEYCDPCLKLLNELYMAQNNAEMLDSEYEVMLDHYLDVHRNCADCAGRVERNRIKMIHIEIAQRKRRFPDGQPS